ncbi:GMC oxidoreductase [Xylariaceae sp. AK1471]|nr:GMC oxidoreductase [Xylariaceae sp. AK1471]
MDTETFDFVIAGGGTAGIVLASRLSEIADQTVLVLEAGLDHSDDPRVKTPALYMAQFGTELDWGFRTIAQENLVGRSLSLNQGKALGGSSVMNAQVYAPPTKAVADAWAELGNEGWNWDIMGPYYNKAFTSPPRTAEDLKGPLGIDSWGSDTTNASGPVQLSFPGDPTHPVRKIWADTFERKGCLMPNNPWIRASVGAFSNLVSVDPVTKERSHAAKAYYDPVKHRENLHVVVNAHVDKIIFADGQSQLKAIGLQYSHGGKSKTAKARKEVIIAAGALQSPKLLELSGVGNAEILKQYNIEVIKDLPGVGENLQDHLLCDICYEVVCEMETLDALARQEPKAIEEALRRFTQDRNGLLTSSGIKTFAYLPALHFVTGTGRDKMISLTEENRPAVSIPPRPDNLRARMYYDIAERTLLDPNQSSSVYFTAIGQNRLSPNPSTGQSMTPQPGKHFTIIGVLAQPLSRGTVHITSNASAEAPEIDPKYLSNPLDMEVFAQHILYIESIASSAPLSGVLRQPLHRQSPLAHITDLDAAKRYLKSRSISMWHPAGTCAMLPLQAGGVVDASLRVHGVNNLRIADASVVPLLPPGNLQSTVYALAERAADLIKDAHGLK